ncbi:MAG: phosphoserine phosphatase SerB [Rhodospirillales bacterium 20-60-12]|nr:MAG: phosphoserine phosphatase SerB [Rhodospirillales bacterium 20-60-12]HQT66122.1 phosphoserine phosphatase SerB [Acetobacteraceae bacterium]
MRFVLTLVAARDKTSLTGPLLKRVRSAIEGGDPIWLSAGEAADIPCMAAPDPRVLEQALDGKPIDAIIVKHRARRKAVLVADMDSTIVTSETLDELAAEAGIKDQIAAITTRSMNGEIDFATALRERVAMLRGLELGALERTWRRTHFMPGAEELVATMRAHGSTTALVSGGFTFFTERVAAALGFDQHRANVLLDNGSFLTGTVAEPILDRDAKLTALQNIAAARGVQLSACIAVGDGANDIAMIRAAGLGVAYHAKPIVAEQARTQIRHADLRALLFAQGYPASSFVT